MNAVFVFGFDFVLVFGVPSVLPAFFFKHFWFVKVWKDFLLS
jgi:hypothetical protein